MSTIKEIRKVTGLSQYQIASWLGVSRSLVQLVEKGERSLPKNASDKLYAMNMFTEQVKGSTPEDQEIPLNKSTREKIALQHKRKMERYLHKATGLQIQLKKIKATRPQAFSRLALIQELRNNNTEWFTKTAQDNKYLELMQWFTENHIAAEKFEEPEILQDRINTLLAYAEIHKKHWNQLADEEPGDK